MTPDELLRQRKQQELLARANAASNTAPSADDALVSENAKQSLKAAGHWAGVLGRRAAEATKQGAAIAAEKARLAAAAAAKKTRQAQATSAERRAAAEQAKAEAENATALTAAPSDNGDLIADGIGRAISPDRAPLVDVAAKPGLLPFENLAPADIAREIQAIHHSSNEEEAASLPEPAIDPNVSPLPEDPLGELPPLPDDAYSEAATASGDATEPTRRRRGWTLALLAVVLVAAGIATFMGFVSEKADGPTKSVGALAVDAPAAPPQPVPLRAPAEPVTSPSAEPVKSSSVQSEAIDPNEVDPLEPTEPKPVLSPSTSRAPTVTPDPAPPAPRATASPKQPLASRAAPRAPAPAPKSASEWQRQAGTDLDAWAKRSGLD